MPKPISQNDDFATLALCSDIAFGYTCISSFASWPCDIVYCEKNLNEIIR